MATIIKADPGMGDYNSGSGECTLNLLHALLLLRLRSACLSCVTVSVDPYGLPSVVTCPSTCSPSSLSHGQIRCRDNLSLAKTICTDVSITLVVGPHGYRCAGHEHARTPSMYPAQSKATYMRLCLFHSTPAPNTHIIVIFFIFQQLFPIYVRHELHILARHANHDARLLSMRPCYRVSLS